jgi:endonuclease-3
MQDDDIHQIIAILRESARQWQPALVDGMARVEPNPFHILITTLLSLRTKDTLTSQVAPRLFTLADTPQEMVRHSAEEIAQVIYPVGFYRNKAKSILAVSQKLLDDYNGQVPADLDELLKLPGVGRKTANLVLTAGFNKLRYLRGYPRASYFQSLGLRANQNTRRNRIRLTREVAAGILD